MAKGRFVGFYCMWCTLLIISSCIMFASPTMETSEEDAGENEGDKKGTRPRGVTAEVLNSTTISLTWKHPKIATEDCAVKRYVLRLKQEGARRSRAWKVDGARKALGLHNLKPDTLYSIRLVAVTCQGKGKPTKWLDIMTSTSKREAARKENGGNKEARLPREEPSGLENRPPGRPTYVRTRTFPDSVILNWQEPAETELVVRGYMVGYGEGVPDVNWQYVDANQRNVTIRNLKPSTQYIISLRAFNNQGKGPTVYDMIYTREFTVEATIDPSTIQTPEGLRAKVLSPTNVWLQWRDPSLDNAQQITDERYYNVHYKALPEGEKLSVVVKALHVVLYELTPGVTYEFTVRTVKDSFYSDFSDPIRNTTYETAPGSSPRSVRVTPGNGTSVLVQWRPPKQPNGQIRGYLVLYSNDRVRPIAEWNAVALSDTNTVIRSLQSGETYYFKVQARNSVGYGPLSKTSAYTIPHGLSSSPDQTNNVISSVYGDFDTNKPDNNGTGQNNAAATGTGQVPEPSVNVTVNNDEEDKTAKVDAANSTTEANAANGITQAQKGKPANSEVQFAAKVLHTISAFITWPSTPPNCNCDTRNIQYIFHLYMRGKEETPEMKQLASNVVHLEDLDPNERYHYQIKYILPDGTETAWSQEQELDTDCGKGSG